MNRYLVRVLKRRDSNISLVLCTREKKVLLQNEYRIIKAREREIRKDSRIVYFYRLKEENKDKGLYKICCDFKLLEEKANQYTN